MALLVLPQFFTTYVTSLLNGLNAKDNLFSSSRHTLKDHIYDAKLRNDAIGNATINDWHFIESTLRCCGDIEMKGYQCKVPTQIGSILFHNFFIRSLVLETRIPTSSRVVLCPEVWKQSRQVQIQGSLPGNIPVTYQSVDIFSNA